MQPRRRDAGADAALRATPASTGSASACSRWRRTCSVRSAAPTTGATSSVAVAAIREAGIPTFNLDLIYGAAGESIDRLGSRRVEAVVALEPPHVSAYALTIEAGTPLATQLDRHPDDDDQADKYETRRHAAGRVRARQLRDLQLGAARARVPPQHPLLASAELPRLRLRRPLPPRPGGAGGTCARPIATSNSCGPASRPRRRARRSTTTHATFERLELLLRMRDGVPLESLDGDDLPGLVERRRRALGAHPPRSPDGQRRQPPSGRLTRHPANRSGNTVGDLGREVVAVGAGPGVHAGAVPAAARRRRRAASRRAAAARPRRPTTDRRSTGTTAGCGPLRLRTRCGVLR